MGSRFSNADFYRLKADYLKLKSALHDRNTNLVSYRARFDELRATFETVRRLGVVVVDLSELTSIESIYGWQVFDRFLRTVAGTLQSLRGSVFPEEALVALDGIGAPRFVIFLATDLEGREVSTPRTQAIGCNIPER